MSRVTEAFLVRERSDRPGDWAVWLRPLCGLPPTICNAWTRRSLRTAPMEFLSRYKWPKNKDQAERIVQALIVYLRDHPDAPSPLVGPTVRDYASLFRDNKSPRARSLAARGKPISPNTVDNYKQKIDDYILSDKPLASLRMAELNRENLEAFFARLNDRHGSTRSVQDTWAILHMIATQWADDNKAPNPFRGMKKPTYQELVRGALSEAELLKIFEDKTWPTPQDRAIVSLAFWAGLRRSEVFALRWEDVDLERGRITVTRAIKRFARAQKLREEGGTKGRKTRIVPLVEESRTALEGMPRLGDRVVVRADKTESTDRDWRNAMAYALSRVGISESSLKARKITPHSSRHTIASILLARGVPIEIIKAILGHFDIKTTEGYLHIAAEELDKAGQKINMR